MLTLYPSPVAAKSDQLDHICVCICDKLQEWVLWQQMMILYLSFAFDGKDQRKTQTLSVNKALGHEDLCPGICKDLHRNHLVKSPLPNFSYHLWTQVSMCRHMHPWFLHLHHLWMQEFFFLTGGTVWVSPPPLTGGVFARISNKRGHRPSRRYQTHDFDKI